MKMEYMRNALAGAITGAFIGALSALYVLPIPGDNQDLIVFMLGQLSGALGTVLGYNFGTTKSSATKDQTIAAMATPDGAP